MAKDDLSQCFNLEIESNVFEMFDNNYEYIGKLKVDACDPEQARILASEIVDVFLSIIQFDKHNNRPFKLRNADVVDLETGECYFLQEPILPIFRGNKAKTMWDKLQTILEFNIPYDKISQTYHAQMGLTDVWDDVNFYEEKDRIHPTQKPQKLLARLILASSDEDDIVLDPFMGGGSTALACINNKRNYIGFEIEQEYYEKSLERLACRQMTLL